MRKLLANLKPYKLQVIVMVLILMIQAYCDLALPEYTQNIIDVGIQNKGIEHILPAKITQEDYRFVTQFMTDQERKLWDNSYTDDGDCFQRKGLEEERLEELDEALLTVWSSPTATSTTCPPPPSVSPSAATRSGTARRSAGSTAGTTWTRTAI